MQTTFQVFASYISVISKSEVRFQLVQTGPQSFAFVNTQTGKVEAGTLVEGAKFLALDAFRSSYREFQPSFELQ